MNQNYLIRKAVESDAEQIILHTKKVLNENPDFFATSIEEFTVTVDEEKKWIHSFEQQGLLLVAEVFL